MILKSASRMPAKLSASTVGKMMERAVAIEKNGAFNGVFNGAFNGAFNGVFNGARVEAPYEKSMHKYAPKLRTVALLFARVL